METENIITADETAEELPALATGERLPESADESQYNQEQINNIVAKETGKAVEKALRELGFEGSGRAKEQVLQFKQQIMHKEEQSAAMAEQLSLLSESLLQAEKQLLQAQIQSKLAFSGVDEQQVEVAARLVNSLIEAEISQEDAIRCVVEKYPHLLAKAQQIPCFSTETKTTGTDKFSGIKEIFRK